VKDEGPLAVSITYCLPCGYKKRADDAAGELRRRFGIGATLIAGKGGIFEVKVGDRVVAKKGLIYFPETEEIVSAVASAVKAGA
jgi:selenoprotein W-related protein